MSLVCFAAQKGSPGTTAAALAVAASLRPGEGRRKLLVEADGSGGALAVRYGLASEPGLVTLAAALRADPDAADVWAHAQELPGGLPVVVAPDGAEQVAAALAASGSRLGRHLADRDDLVAIGDLGRLWPGSPAIDLAAEADAVLMVARPTAEQLQPAARRLGALRPVVRHLGWVLIGDRPYGPAEVEATFGFPVVGVLADDRSTVEALEGGAMTRRLRRRPYVRSAATLADVLGGWLAGPATPSPIAAPPEPEAAPAEGWSPGPDPGSERLSPEAGAGEGWSPGADPGSGRLSPEAGAGEGWSPGADPGWERPSPEAGAGEGWSPGADAGWERPSPEADPEAAWPSRSGTGDEVGDEPDRSDTGEPVRALEPEALPDTGTVAIGMPAYRRTAPGAPRPAPVPPSPPVAPAPEADCDAGPIEPPDLFREAR